MFPNKKKIPPKAGASGIAPKSFSRAQQAEDTEREMTGKPQRFGAAASDDDKPSIKGALDPTPVNNHDANDVDSGVDSPGSDDQQADPHTEIAQLKAHNQALEARLEALENHTGIKKSAAAPPPADPHDDDEYMG